MSASARSEPCRPAVSNMRRARKVDANQPEIVKALRQAHVEVEVLSDVGRGVPDLLCFNVHVGLRLLECKMPGDKQNADQERFAARFPVHVVRSVDEALKAMGLL